ncbi:MAG TPA: flagellum-specific ATP synthase FliI, partial [Candidatus Limnocylindria bacterium]|nr:flagellum-specific ATP synthase FliI [Candidatus Limnocylindria bacterium]
LISIGAYPPGSNAAVDRAIRLQEPLNTFLKQAVSQGVSSKESWQLLADVMKPAEREKTTTLAPRRA